MNFDKFLERGRKIVAEHRAQYHGIYYMKGGIIGEAEKFAGPILDVAALAFGQPELLPLAQAAGGTISGLSQGESFGKAIGQGAIQGGEAFAGQELIGAAANAFPETAGSIGLNTSGNTLSDIIGTSQGAGSLTGAGTIGGDVSSLFSGGGLNSATTPSAGVSSAAPKGVLPTSVSAPTGGGAVPGGAAVAPTGSQSATDWLDNFNATGGASNLSSPISSNVGTGTVGTQGVSNTANFDLSGNIAGSPSLASAGNAAGSNGGLLNKVVNGAESSLGKNPLGIGASAIGLGLDAIKGNKALAGETQLKEQAAQLSQQGQGLGSYLQSGTLPPGLQQSLNQATEAAKASIRSQYAARGMSGSSAEQQDLAQVDSRAQAQGAEQALQLLQTGISETGMASQLYQALMGESLQQDQALSGAISSFASAAGGGGQGGGFKIVPSTQPGA